MSFDRLKAIYVGEMRGALSEYYEMSLRDLMTAIVGYRSAKIKDSIESWEQVNALGFYSMIMHVASKGDREKLERQMLGRSSSDKLKPLTMEEALKKSQENLEFFKHLKTA